MAALFPALFCRWRKRSFSLRDGSALSRPFLQVAETLLPLKDGSAVSRPVLQAADGAAASPVRGSLAKADTTKRTRKTGETSHYCHQRCLMTHSAKRTLKRTHKCGRPGCQLWYCGVCLRIRYGHATLRAAQRASGGGDGGEGSETWLCPRCEGRCNCSRCNCLPVPRSN